MQGLNVFREAAAAVSNAREEEPGSNPGVGAHAAAHLVHVGTNFLAEVRDLVHERDLGGEEAVGGVLRQLGTALVHDDQRVALADEGLVQARHHLLCPVAAHADHHAVRLQEIVDRIALAEEFRVGDHVEVHGSVGAHRSGHFLGRTDRHRALVHDDLVLGDHLAELVSHAEHIAQVGTAVLSGRRRQREEDDVCGLHRLREVGGEGQPAGLDVAFEQHVEVGLVDGHLPVAHFLDLGGIDVDTHDIVSGFCKTGA